MFEGVLTALVTPFKQDEIDEPALRMLVDEQIAAGIDGLVPCGSTGESATPCQDIWAKSREEPKMSSSIDSRVQKSGPPMAGRSRPKTRASVI